MNRKYIVNIINYLISVKGDKLFLNNGKNQILKTEDNNPDESLKGNKKLNNEFGKKNNNDNEIQIKIFMEEEEIAIKKLETEELIGKFEKIFEKERLKRILFNEITHLVNKEEYLEMHLLFLPEKETQQILKVIKEKLNQDNKKKKILVIFETIFQKINLKTESGFHFLKDIIILFLKDKNNFINTYKEIEHKYILENKELRCVQCFNLPIFLINNENIINIRYKCEDFHSNNNDKLEENYKI